MKKIIADIIGNLTQDFHLFYYLFKFLLESLWQSLFYPCSIPSLYFLYGQCMWISAAHHLLNQGPKLFAQWVWKFHLSPFSCCAELAGLFPPIPNSYSIQGIYNVCGHWTNGIVATSSLFTGSSLLLILTAGAVMNFLTLLFILLSIKSFQLWSFGVLMSSLRFHSVICLSVKNWKILMKVVTFLATHLCFHICCLLIDTSSWS